MSWFRVFALLLFAALGGALTILHSHVVVLREDQEDLRQEHDKQMAKLDEAIAAVGTRITLLNARMDALEAAQQLPSEPRRRTPIRDFFDSNRKKGAQP